MATELIMPVGTSLLRALATHDPGFRFPAGWMFPGHPGADPDAKRPNMQHTRVIAGQLLDKPRTCAEIDSTRAWLRKRGVALARITLISSDTEAGGFCAEVLETVLPKALGSKAQVERQTVEKLGTDKLNSGLRNYVHDLTDLIKGARSREQEVAINATPGFKPEAGLALLVGATSGAYVFYLHESMKEVMEFPPVPLSWDLDPTDLATLTLMNTNPEHAGARDLDIGRRPRLWPFVYRDEDLDCWGLTALGELVRTTLGGTPDAGLPQHRDGPFTFDSSVSEQGHQPREARAIAERIGAELPFVHTAVLYGWKGRGREGMRPALPQDAEDYAIRIHAECAHDDRILKLKLLTTAGSENEWREARTQTGHRLGYSPDEDELRDDLAAGTGTSHQDFEQLRFEAIAQRCLELESERAGQLEADNAKLGAELDACTESLREANERAGLARQRADRLAAERNDLRTHLTKLGEKHHDALMEIERLRAELAAAREKVSEDQLSEPSDPDVMETEEPQEVP